MVDNVRIVNGDASQPAGVYKAVATNALLTADYLNSMVDEGTLFSITGISEGIINDASSEILIVVPAGLELHLAISGNSSGDAFAYMFEGTTVSANGTTLTSINRNRSSDELPDCSFYGAPTITLDGDALFASFAPGGIKKSAVGSSGSSFGAWLLSEGSYLLRFTNKSGVDAVMSIILDFYEADA